MSNAKVGAAGALWLAVLGLLTATVAHHHHFTVWTLVAAGVAMLVTIDVQLDRHRRKMVEIVYLATVAQAPIPTPRQAVDPARASWTLARQPR